MSQAEMNLLMERIGRLEMDCNAQRRENTRWCKAVFGLSFIGLAALAFGADKPAPHPKTIEADRIILKDKTGKTRALLAMNEHHRGPMLEFYDEAGKTRVALDLPDELGPQLTLLGEDGKSAVHMTNAFHAPQFHLRAPNGRMLALHAEDDLTEIEFFHEDRDDQVNACEMRLLSRGQGAGLDVFDSGEGVIGFGKTSKGGSKDFLIRDHRGNDRVRIGTNTDGEGFLRILSEDKKNLFQAPRP